MRSIRLLLVTSIGVVTSHFFDERRQEKSKVVRMIDHRSSPGATVAIRPAQCRHERGGSFLALANFDQCLASHQADLGIAVVENLVHAATTSPRLAGSTPIIPSARAAAKRTYRSSSSRELMSLETAGRAVRRVQPTPPWRTDVLAGSDLRSAHQQTHGFVDLPRRDRSSEGRCCFSTNIDRLIGPKLPAQAPRRTPNAETGPQRQGQECDQNCKRPQVPAAVEVVSSALTGSFVSVEPFV